MVDNTHIKEIETMTNWRELRVYLDPADSDWSESLAEVLATDPTNLDSAVVKERVHRGGRRKRGLGYPAR